MPNTVKPTYITGAVQNYAWGRYGHESSVALLSNADTPKYTIIDEKKTYAELWYGTHPSGQSTVIPTGVDKASFTKDQGIPLQDYTQEALPYILKVLSINGALSLQAHPDLALAKQLHKSAPEHYKDANHKPELVVAITPMHVLCGFRPLREIYEFTQSTPEFATLIATSLPALTQFVQSGSTDADHEKKILRELFGECMYADASLVGPLIDSFASRHSSLAGVYDRTVQQAIKDNTLAEFPTKFTPCAPETTFALMHSLSQQYPGDVGMFGPLLLNYFTLAPQQSVFLGPNIPHAYLYGECIEAMACSDNVVRAGLTPKYRDVNTLVTMLTYDTHTPAVNSGAKVDVSGVSCVYAPPCDFPEFMVTRTHVLHGDTQSHTLATLQSHSVALCLSGHCVLTVSHDGEDCELEMTRGSAVLVPGSWSARVKSDDGVLLYRCSANEAHKK